MEFSTYQQESQSTAIYPNRGKNFVYPALGLCGEAGEVAEKIKKIIRDKNGIPTSEDRQLIAKELGDVLWYLARIAEELNFNLDYIARLNLQKLKDRQMRQVLAGNGDTR